MIKICIFFLFRPTNQDTCNSKQLLVLCRNLDQYSFRTKKYQKKFFSLLEPAIYNLCRFIYPLHISEYYFNHYVKLMLYIYAYYFERYVRLMICTFYNVSKIQHLQFSFRKRCAPYLIICWVSNLYDILIRLYGYFQKKKRK